MAPKKETHEQKMTRVARELGSALREQAAGRWGEVRTADRGEDHGHAWKFRTSPKDDGRFLRVSHRAMEERDVPTLLEHLAAGRWLDRLNEETSLMLHADGRLEPPANR
ncbi:MAG TPA: hypothetical protein VF263_18860 [Longimicrobiaceae bacterium]